jgi:death-on-curing protein
MSYGPAEDLADLAAAYGFGIARNHPFADGNKRTAFLVMIAFLGLNGRDFDATETEVVTTMLELAAGRLTETKLAKWIRDHSPAVRRRAR